MFHVCSKLIFALLVSLMYRWYGLSWKCRLLPRSWKDGVVFQRLVILAEPNNTNHFASGQDDARLRKVRVTGNTFICPGNVGLVALRPYRDEDGLPDARDMKITDNVFHVENATAIRISGVQALTSRGNTVECAGNNSTSSKVRASCTICMDKNQACW